MSQPGNPKIISRFNPAKKEVPPSPGGKNHLLVIAIDEYEHCPRLYRAVADAQELMSVLADKYLFEKENMTALFNREATDRNIQRAFRQLVDRVTENDSLVIFYSGHGWFDEKMRTGYWIPVEAALGEPYDYISNSIIFDYLDAIRARHIFLVADSCFSGSLFGATKNVGTTERLERDPSRWCLTAGRNEIVVEHGEGSPFAKSLIYQLQASTQSLGVMNLCDKVTTAVGDKENQMPRGEPLRLQAHQGGQFFFHLRKNEEREWLTIRDKGSKQQVSHFLLQYPGSRFEGEAMQRLAHIEEDEVWAAAKRRDLMAGYFEYLNKFKSGRYATEAQQRIRALSDDDEAPAEEALLAGKLEAIRQSFRKAKSQVELERLLAELNALPVQQAGNEEIVKLKKELTAALEAKEKEEVMLWEAALVDNSAAEFQNYLEKYPAGKFVQEASQRLKTLRDAELAQKEEEDAWKKAKLKDTARVYQDYLKKHPQGSYVRQANARLKELKNNATHSPRSAAVGGAGASKTSAAEADSNKGSAQNMSVKTGATITVKPPTATTPAKSGGFFSWLWKASGVLLFVAVALWKGGCFDQEIEPTKPINIGVAMPKPVQDVSGKWGFQFAGLDSFVIPAIYQEAKPFSEGKAPVKWNGYWGVIRLDGHFAVPFVYDNIEGYKDGWAEVSVLAGSEVKKFSIDGEGKPRLFPVLLSGVLAERKYNFFVTLGEGERQEGDCPTAVRFFNQAMDAIEGTPLYSTMGAEARNGIAFCDSVYLPPAPRLGN